MYNDLNKKILLSFNQLQVYILFKMLLVSALGNTSLYYYYYYYFFFIIIIIIIIYIHLSHVQPHALYRNIDQTLVNSLHGLLNCEIGGIEFRVITADYLSSVH